MKLLQIAHKKPECIGCMLCAEVAPEYWEMDDFGEAQLLQISHERDAFQYAQGFPNDLEILKQAEEGCPVNIIKVS